MRKLFPLIKNRLGLFSIGTITGILAGVSTSYVISMIKDGLDNVENIDGSFIIQIITFSLVAALLGVASGYFMAKITAIVVRNLTQSLSEKILKANYEYIESNSERIVPVLTRDISVLSEFIHRFPQFIISSTTVLITLYLLFLADWQLTSFFISAFIIQVFIISATLPLVRKLARRSTKYNNFLYRDLANLVSGLKELSLSQSRRNEYISNVISSNLHNWNDSVMKSKVLYETTDKLTDLLIFVFSGLLMFLGVTILPIDFHMFKVILPTILFLIPFTVKIASYFRFRSTAIVSLNQIHQLGIDVGNQKLDSSKELTTPHVATEDILRFENLKFQYRTSKHENPITFGPLNVSFKKNNITFIIGGNGSGKTTFTKILTGLYIPTEGKIHYYDQQIEESNLISYRDLFSSYFTDSHVFEYLSHIEQGFLNDNAEDYIAMLQMEHKVSLEKNKFSTTKLSYGQKSRLGLIANMLDNKDIYVFDEWAANQDPYFKGIFYHEILPFLKKQGKTVIVISHDEKYFGIADEIIELQEGMTIANTSNK
ncbi:cyclic peptide export ABC transporter [Ekhidna sp.]